MSLTLSEILERMAARMDPDMLVEELDISSEELLEYFDYKVRERFDYWTREMEQ